MLTGKSAFEGATAASVIGAILERSAPSVSEVAPLSLDSVLKRCLEKDSENRWQSARDLKSALELVGQAIEPAPDGQHFVHLVFGGRTDVHGVYVASLDGTPAVRLLPDETGALYVDAASSGQGSSGSGYLLFQRGTTLMAQPFEPTTLLLSGDVFPVAELGRGFAFWSVSANGTLAYAGGAATVQLAWTDRSGKALGQFGPPQVYEDGFRLAPDEKRILFNTTQSDNQDVWVFHSTRGATSRLTFDAAFDNLAIWSPAGQRFVWPSNRGGGFDLYEKSANGTGKEELLVKMSSPTGWATDWSKDGRFLLYQKPGEKTGEDLWVAPQPRDSSGDRKPYPYLQTEFDESEGRFSPDGHLGRVCFQRQRPE